MDATPIDTDDARPLGGGSAHADLVSVAAGSLALKWSALHQAADTLATVAGLVPAQRSAQVRDFPRAIQHAGGWRRRLAEQQVDDLTAIMEIGVSALIAAFHHGAAPFAAARTLAEEFEHARDATLTLLPPESLARPVA